MEGNSVLVLLSSYNGEKYIEQQIESLLAQVGVEITILIRDDGSSDHTLEIVEKMFKGTKHIYFKGDNVGPALSFYNLMKLAFEKYNQYDYFAFCDQDDIWHNDKLLTAISTMKTTEENANACKKLYFCSSDIINETSKKIASSSKRYFNNIDYRMCFHRNPALGCTMVFNFNLLHECIKIWDYIQSTSYDKRYLPMHDAWMFCVANFTNTLIFADKKEKIHYRKHNLNVTASQKNLLQRIKNLVIRRLFEKPRYAENVAKTVLENIQVNDEKKKQFLVLLSSGKKDIISVFKRLYYVKLSGEIFPIRIFYYFLIMINRY